MESKANYTLVGIIVLFLTAALLSTLLWLSVGFERKKYHTYLVYINESIHGLNEDSPVKFNGVKVGQVKEVVLDSTDPQRIRLLLDIEDGVPITISTHATLVTQGITGTTFLGLSADSPSLTPLQRVGNEPYPVIPYTVSFFNQLQTNLTDLSNNLKKIIDPENAHLFKQSLLNLQKITHTIELNNQNINKSLQNLPNAILQLKASAQDVGIMANNITNASGEFSKTMHAGKESIEQINQQTIPSTTALIQRIDTIAANLEQVSAQMRQNPAVIIRGSAPKTPGPGE